MNGKSVNPSWQAEVTCISRHTLGVGQKRTLFHPGNMLSVRRFGRMSAMLVCENLCRNHWCYQPSRRIRTISSPSTCTWVPLRRIHGSVCYPSCKAIHWRHCMAFTRKFTWNTNVLQLEGDSDGKLLVLPAAIGSAISAAVAGISFTMVYIEPPVALPWASMHWSVQCCSVAFLLLLPVSVKIVVALSTVFVNSTKIRGSVLLSCQYHLNKKSPQFTMGCTEVNLLSKHPLPQKVSRPHCDPGCSDTRSKITTKWSFHLVAAGASSFH